MLPLDFETTDQENETILELLRSLHALAANTHTDDHALAALDTFGLSPVVYPRLHQYIQSGALSQGSEAHRSVVQALALPFPTMRAFSIRGEINGSLPGLDFRQTSIDQYMADRLGAEQVECIITPVLATLGACACWSYEHGLSGVGIADGLYRLPYHNVDTPPQIIAGILGIAHLAYWAAQYELEHTTPPCTMG